MRQHPARQAALAAIDERVEIIRRELSDADFLPAFRVLLAVKLYILEREWEDAA